jgi:peptidoglycan biosynthesis protein MviN/MurJ (putative lipid II flippase)
VGQYNKLKKEKMKNRLISNYVTTILGVLIIIFCGVMMFMEKATASELSGWLAVGLMFLRSKDSLIALPKDDK